MTQTEHIPDAANSKAATARQQIENDYHQLNEIAEETGVPVAGPGMPDAPIVADDWHQSQYEDVRTHGIRRGNVTIDDHKPYRSMPSSKPDVMMGLETDQDKIGVVMGSQSPVKAQAKEPTGIYTAVSATHKGYDGNYPTPLKPASSSVKIERPDGNGGTYETVIDGPSAEKAALLIGKRVARRVQRQIEQRSDSTSEEQNIQTDK